PRSAETPRTSPRGRTFPTASASRSGSATVLSACSTPPTAGWVREPVVGHRGYVATTAYSPAGDRVVSGGADGDVSLWNGRTGAFLGSLHIGSPQVQVAAAFAQDGHTVLAMDMLGTVARWDTRPDAWIRHACPLAGRSLTTSEWRDAFGDRRYQPACIPKK
ncbi:MAG: WD40 repeat domain-containing protein, partial [Actinomycetes bacterium]